MNCEKRTPREITRWNLACCNGLALLISTPGLNWLVVRKTEITGAANPVLSEPIAIRSSAREKRLERNHGSSPLACGWRNGTKIQFLSSRESACAPSRSKALLKVPRDNTSTPPGSTSLSQDQRPLYLWVHASLTSCTPRRSEQRCLCTQVLLAESCPQNRFPAPRRIRQARNVHPNS